jgi:hypothetical protein
MKLLVVVLLVCLLVTGTVSAVSMSVGSVQAAKTIVPATAQTQKIAASALPGVLVTQETGVAYIGVYVYSTPSNATVTADGYTYTDSTTPINLAFPPGTHTIVLSHTKYKDYTITLDLKAGMPTQYISADLEPKIQASAVSASAISASAVSEAGWITVNIDSIPSNATVTDLYNGTYIGMTPLHLHVSPEMHFVKISHPLYNWAGLRFNQSQDIVVTLVRTDIGPLTGQKANAAETVGWQSGIAPAGPALQAGNFTSFVTVPTTPLTYTDCPPDSVWICLTQAEAEQRFGTYAKLGDTPCGLEENYGSPLATIKFCYSDAPLWSVSSSALDAAGIKNGDDIYIMNKTWIEHAVVNKSPEVRQTGGAGTNPFQSFLDFLSGILSGSSKPESKLEIVGFNPCPEPPGQPVPELAR